MRVLFLTNFFPPHHFGGYEELCADVAKGLAQRGHAISILTSKYGAQTSSNAGDGIVRRLHNDVDARAGHGTAQFFWGRERRLRENVAILHEMVTDFCPDVVLVWGTWNLPRAMLVEAEGWRQPPIVYYIADLWPTLPDAYTLHWSAPASRPIMRLPKALVGRFALRVNGSAKTPPLRFERAMCVSRALKEKLMDEGVPLCSARVVHNGIDAKSVAMHRTISQADGDPRALRLLYAGRLSPDKGVHIALAALAKVWQEKVPVTLAIIGSGTTGYEMELRRQCVQLGIAQHVTFFGRVPREQMPQTIAQYDVLIVPSTGLDSLPRIAQEGMAAGMAVIASAIGGLPELISDGVNGLLCAPNDAADLARQIERLLKYPELRARLAAAGQSTVREQFTLERTVEEIERFLMSVIVARN